MMLGHEVILPVNLMTVMVDKIKDQHLPEYVPFGMLYKYNAQFRWTVT